MSRSAPGAWMLADDLTGALDAGVQATVAGMAVSVCLNVTDAASAFATASADLLVIDTETRDASDAAAREAVETVWEVAVAADVRLLYKKIDSTLRGHIGVEIAVLGERIDRAGILICPALPAMGRTVVDGRLLVRGMPVDESEYADDPTWPITTASIVELLERAGGLFARVSGAPSVQVADATTDADLRALARRCRDEQLLPVGSAGLFAYVVGQETTSDAGPESDGVDAVRAPARQPAIAGTDRAILVVCGSVTPVSRRQLIALVDAAGLDDSRILRLDDDQHHDAELADRGSTLMTSDRMAVLTTESGRIGEPLEVAGRLAAIAARLPRPAGVVLTGGETARQVLRGVGARGLDVTGEVEPYIPAAVISGGSWDGVPVVTKSGGFGQPGTLDAARRFLLAEEP